VVVGKDIFTRSVEDQLTLGRIFVACWLWLGTGYVLAPCRVEITPVFLFFLHTGTTTERVRDMNMVIHISSSITDKSTDYTQLQIIIKKCKKRLANIKHSAGKLSIYSGRHRIYDKTQIK